MPVNNSSGEMCKIVLTNGSDGVDMGNSITVSDNSQMYAKACFGIRFSCELVVMKEREVVVISK